MARQFIKPCGSFQLPASPRMTTRRPHSAWRSSPVPNSLSVTRRAHTYSQHSEGTLATHKSHTLVVLPVRLSRVSVVKRTVATATRSLLYRHAAVLIEQTSIGRRQRRADRACTAKRSHHHRARATEREQDATTTAAPTCTSVARTERL